MENNLQADTETLMQICTDTLVRNLLLWRVQELVSRLIFISSKDLEILCKKNGGTLLTK
jgi:hypothetical protein